MRAGHRAQGKLSPQGASLARGARGQQHQQRQHSPHPPPAGQQQGVVVKQEVVVEGEAGSMGWGDSRQLLRRSIMERRQARGLGELSLDGCADPSPAQHQLTPEEVEKKERRKEQNRRAARKCRQKKRMLQSDKEEDYAKMMANNRKLEKESSMLKAQVASLQKELNDHLQSGQCRHVLLDNTCPVTATPASSLPSPLTSTFPASCLPSAEVEQLNVSSYLTDIGDLTPAQTFTDQALEILINLTQYVDAEGLDYPTIPQADDNDNLKTLPPESPTHGTCLSTPTSPTLRDRHSVSSEASDWSAGSDPSQGFGQVPTVGGSPTPIRCDLGRGFMRSLNSTGEWEAEVSSPGYCQQVMGVPMDSDMDDEVFRERGYAP